MKITKIITHPFLLIGSFLFLLISGEHWGGFYLMYVLLALPHGAVHSLLAVAGTLILLYSYLKFRRTRKTNAEPVSNIIGALCFIFSAWIFFYNDKQGYNDGTFEQTAPQITMVIFCLLSLIFIIYNLLSLGLSKKNRDPLSLEKA